jgi:hypothetical protein
VTVSREKVFDVCGCVCPKPSAEAAQVLLFLALGRGAVHVGSKVDCGLSCARISPRFRNFKSINQKNIVVAN